MGYLKTVKSLDMRNTMRQEEMPWVFEREPKCAWLSLTEDERKGRIAQSEHRRKKQTETMNKAQFDIEKK
jgi:hypothetical protein